MTKNKYVLGARVMYTGNGEVNYGTIVPSNDPSIRRDGKTIIWILIDDVGNPGWTTTDDPLLSLVDPNPYDLEPLS